VLITGAGPIGIMAGMVARHAGARHVVITDINQERLDLAGRAADITPANIATTDLMDVRAKLGMREGFDIGMEMSGAPAAMSQMIEQMIMGGKIAVLGIPSKPVETDWIAIVFKALTIKGIYGREMFETWYKMIAMIQSGLDLRAIVTDRLPVADYRTGFHRMGEGSCGKVVLDWG
jgi:threonine 3-dehydrogenase